MAYRSKTVKHEGMIPEDASVPDIDVPGIRYPRIQKDGAGPRWGYIDPSMMGDDWTSGLEALKLANLTRLKNSEEDLATLARLGGLATSLIDVAGEAWELRENIRDRYAALHNHERERVPRPEKHLVEVEVVDVSSATAAAIAKMGRK